MPHALGPEQSVEPIRPRIIFDTRGAVEKALVGLSRRLIFLLEEIVEAATFQAVSAKRIDGYDFRAQDRRLARRIFEDDLKLEPSMDDFRLEMDGNVRQQITVGDKFGVKLRGPPRGATGQLRNI